MRIWSAEVVSGNENKNNLLDGNIQLQKKGERRDVGEFRLFEKKTLMNAHVRLEWTGMHIYYYTTACIIIPWRNKERNPNPSRNEEYKSNNSTFANVFSIICLFNESPSLYTFLFYAHVLVFSYIYEQLYTLYTPA